MRDKKKKEALKEMDIDYDFPGYQAPVSKMSDQDTADNKKEKVKRRKDSIDAQKPPVKLTKKQRKDSVDISLENKAPRSMDAPLEKFPKKKSESIWAIPWEPRRSSSPCRRIQVWLCEAQ
jgi:hypothetical protein